MSLQKKYWTWYLIILGNAFLLSCKNTPSTSTTPKAPTESYKYNLMDVQNEKHRSVVHIPLEVPIKDLTQHLNTQLQGLIYEDNDIESGLKLKVWKRAPITAESRDSLLFYTVPLKIWAEKSYQVLGVKGAQSTDFQINLKFFTKIEMQPDWKVKTQTVSAGFDWITKPNLKIAGLEVPITGIVSRLISENLGKVSKAIDDNVSQNFVVKPYILQAWNLLREPRLLSDEYQTWLLITPIEISMTPFQIQRGKISATVGVRGFTQTYTGTQPAYKPASDIPPLTISEAVPKGFQIGVIGILPYESASSLAAAQFVGKTFEFKDGKYKIEVTSIQIYGQNDKLVIKTGLKGDVNGVIYLKGIPYYDAKTRMVSLRQIDYDLDTKSLLIKTANWLLQGRFIKQIEQNFTFSMGEQLEETQKEIRQQLVMKRVAKGVEVGGRLETFEPDQIYLTPEALVALVVAKGYLEVKIDGLF
ncbi:MAG: DUF4403 family protein [Runella sp.]